MKEDLVIAALEKWSPHGLCSNVLVERNGDPKKTIGCTLGCLAIEAIQATELHSRKKKRLVGELYKEGSLPGLQHNLVKEHFDLTSKEICALVSYNDTEFPSASTSLPEEVVACITRLRLKFEKWLVGLPPKEQEEFGPQHEDDGS